MLKEGLKGHCGLGHHHKQVPVFLHVQKKKIKSWSGTGAKRAGPSAIIKEFFPKQDFLGTQSADHTLLSQSPTCMFQQLYSHLFCFITCNFFLKILAVCLNLLMTQSIFFSSFEISQSWSVQPQSSQLQPLLPHPETNTKSIQQVPFTLHNLWSKIQVRLFSKMQLRRWIKILMSVLIYY